MKIRVAGVWRDIIGAKIRQAGSWRTIIAVKIYSGGSWRSAGTFSPTGTSGGMTLEIRTPANNTPGTEAVQTSGNCITRVSNGSSPFTYSWSVISTTGPGTVDPIDASLARTGFTATFTTTGTITCTIECVCTDKAGNIASDTAELTFIRT